MSDDFGEISYLDDREGAGYVDMSRLRNFASDDFDDEPEGNEDGGDTPSDDDEPGAGKIILTMLGILLVLAAIGGAIWYFVLGGDAVVARLLDDGETSAIEQTDGTEGGEDTTEASDIPESNRDKIPLAESKTTTVAAFVAELKERGFETEGLDVDIPYTSDGEAYVGTEGISGVGTSDSSGQPTDTVAGDGSTAGANAVTNGSVVEEGTVAAATADSATPSDAVDGAVSEQEKVDADKDGKSTEEAKTEGTTDADKDSTSNTRGERFPILRARFKRSDGAEFEVEWMDGDIKMRLISDADGRLTKAVYIVETDEVVGFDPLHLTIWREKLSETSEFACRTREVTADVMELVDFAAARDAIAGTGNISDILGRRPQDGTATEEKKDGEKADAAADASSADTSSASASSTSASGTDASSSADAAPAN